MTSELMEDLNNKIINLTHDDPIGLRVVEKDIFETLDELWERKTNGDKYLSYSYDDRCNLAQPINKHGLATFDNNFSAAEYCYKNTTDIDIYQTISIDRSIHLLENAALGITDAYSKHDDSFRKAIVDGVNLIELKEGMLECAGIPGSYMDSLVRYGEPHLNLINNERVYRNEGYDPWWIVNGSERYEKLDSMIIRLNSSNEGSIVYKEIAKEAWNLRDNWGMYEHFLERKNSTARNLKHDSLRSKHKKGNDLIDRKKRKGRKI